MLAAKLRTTGKLDETGKIIAAMMVKPDSTRRAAIKALVEGLIEDGLWDKLDLLYVMAAHDAQAARVNWKEPSNFEASVVGSPSFTTDSGYSGSGTSYLNSGRAFNAMDFYAQTDAHFGVWSETNLSDSATPEVGILSSLVYLNARVSDEISGSDFALHNSSAVRVTMNSSTAAHWIVNRTSSANSVLYRDGSQIGSANSQSLTAVPSVNFAFCHSARRLSIAHCGSSLDSTQRSNLRTRLNTYRAAL